MNAMYLEYDVAAYFNHVTPVDDRVVLDWGCNHANFLQYGASPATYDGLDIDKSVLDANAQKWPKHNWHHYPAYNWQYSCKPDANPEWPFTEQDRFDLVVAFSVFTHTDFAEFHETVTRLRCRHLAPDGEVLATFIANNDYAMFCRILSHRPEYFDDKDRELFKTISINPYTVLVVEPDSGQKHLFVDVDRLPRFDKPVYFLSFYDPNWLAHTLGGTVARPDLEFDSGIRSTQQCLRLSTQV